MPVCAPQDAVMDRCIQPRLVSLTKLEAARRQIESAIWLWFVDDNYVSIYALAAAAHRLLKELTTLRESAPWPYAAAYLPEPVAKAGRLDRDDAFTFFKSARQKESYEVSEQWTETYLFDAVMAYSSLAEDRSPSALMATFVVRFGVQRPDLFVRDAFTLLERRVNESFNLKRLERLSKIEFLREFIDVLRTAPD
ncbi:hypothetical protein BH20VER3_BH20VER3_16330 [soil metagenome]